jgi:O-antigen/teichoic acid export membrane protein
MNVLFDFNSSWYVLFFAFLGSWLILLFVRRRSQGRKEIKEQVLLALSGMFSLALMEFFAVSTNLWNYTPGNWPVILWPTYFAAILFGYQLLRSIEGLLHRPAFASKVKREDRSTITPAKRGS